MTAIRRAARALDLAGQASSVRRLLRIRSVMPHTMCPPSEIARDAPRRAARGDLDSTASAGSASDASVDPERGRDLVARLDRDVGPHHATNGVTMIGGSTGVRGLSSSSVPNTRPSRARSMPVSSRVSRTAVSCSVASVGIAAPAGKRDVPAPRIVVPLRSLDQQQLDASPPCVEARSRPPRAAARRRPARAHRGARRARRCRRRSVG